MHENDEQAFGKLQNMIIPHLKIRDSKSPPKAQVDEASLQQAMDKNKESLKMKLMNRRPINQLVDQGIIPSLKVPPHYYEQRQKLERAKMGDFLKHKIQRRPDRQELIQQHILEDTKIDPSLQDKQRQLKKARLADDLNDRLSHRPGPLELVKGNILVADEKFAQAIKEGQIPFKRTCEGQAVRHPLPSFALEDDSGSDVALSPPQDVLDQSLSGMSSMDSMVLSPYTNQESPTNSMGELRITTSTPPSTLSSPISTQSCSLPQAEQAHKENSTTTVRSRKKSKPKSSQPKTRTIKFHEYKGPPSAQKNQASMTQEETSYELLLQQQQLFLQWHLEWQQKYPQMILPVTHQPLTDQAKGNMNQPQSPEQSQDLSVPSPQPLVSKFEDLKVNDLKAELKRRNLPVSGSKPQLIERLKNHLDSNNSSMKSIEKSNIETTTVPINVSGIILDTIPTLMTQQDPVTSVVAVEAPLTSNTRPLTISEDPALLVYNAVPVQGQIVASRPSSTAPMDIEMNSNSDAMDCTENANAINENIVKLQQKKIQQLQRELQRSKMQLQQQQWLQQQQQAKQQAQQQVLLATQPVPIAPALPAATHVATTAALTTSIPPTSTVDTKALQKLQQHLQQKFQQQQLLQQLQQQASNGGKFAAGSPAMSAAVKANLAAFIHNQQANSVRLPNTLAPVNHQNVGAYTNFKNILLCPTHPLQAIVEKPRANSLPSGFGQQKLVWTSSVPNFSNVLPVKPVQTENASKKAPPDYTEATKQLTKTKQDKSQSSSKRSGRKSVKSPAVDDVLEILIKNGELPPSAAQEPPTPTTPETQKAISMAPVFPSVSTVETTVSTNSSSQLEDQDSLNLLPIKMESESLSGQEQNTALGFDPSLLLELQNIESMDLGILDTSDCAPQTSFSDMSQQSQQGNNSCSNNSDSVMDVELPDWLEVYANNNPLSSTSSQQRSFNYNSDPLLPSMGNSQEILDMFSLDDLDFKAPADANILSWDKVDFAT